VRAAAGVGGDRGLATIWVLTACGLLIAVAMGALAVAQVVLLRHHLGSAADNAALAAAARVLDGDECRAASRVAAAHGVRLDVCVVDTGGTVLVRVSAPAPGLVARMVPRMEGRARAGPAE
jgi:secretion/DNA translocation related TadE-like protein